MTRGAGIGYGGVRAPKVKATARGAARIPKGVLRSIPCEQCGAETDQPCVSGTGNPLGTVHRQRRHQTMQAYLSTLS